MNELKKKIVIFQSLNVNKNKFIKIFLKNLYLLLEMLLFISYIKHRSIIKQYNSRYKHKQQVTKK